jgi:hypothetical protein
VQLLDTPGGLAHFPGLAAAVAQSLLPLAAHLTLCALREARRRQGGKCKPRRQSRSDVSVSTDHASVSFQFLSSPRTRHQRALQEIVELSALHCRKSAGRKPQEPLQNCHAQAEAVKCMLARGRGGARGGHTSGGVSGPTVGAGECPSILFAQNIGVAFTCFGKRDELRGNWPARHEMG